RQQLERRYPDAEFVRLGAEHAARHADVVSQVEALEDVEVARAHRIRADVHLHALAAVGDDEEARLAEPADAEDAPWHAHFGTLALEHFGRRRPVPLDER